MEIMTNGHRRPDNARRTWPVALAWLVASVAGCGGSGGGSSGGPDQPQLAGGPDGTLNVTVRDVFGAPVSGALVSVSMHMGSAPSPAASFTDAFGKAQIRGVPAGAFALDAQKNGGFGYLRAGISNGQAMGVDMVMHPASQDAGGVVRAWVPEGGLSADGRTLEFKLQLSDVPGKTRIYAYYSDWADHVWENPKAVLPERSQPLISNPLAEFLWHIANSFIGYFARAWLTSPLACASRKDTARDSCISQWADSYGTLLLVLPHTRRIYIFSRLLHIHQPCVLPFRCACLVGSNTVALC